MFNKAEQTRSLFFPLFFPSRPDAEGESTDNCSPTFNFFSFVLFPRLEDAMQMMMMMMMLRCW